MALTWKLVSCPLILGRARPSGGYGMRPLMACVLLAIFFSPGSTCLAQIAAPTTDTLARAARYYLFVTPSTTRSVVTVLLPPEEAPWFFESRWEVRQFERVLIWWPGRSLTSPEIEKCRNLFLECYEAAWPKAADAFGSDLALFNLCCGGMPSGLYNFQHLVLNATMLERLRKEFPGNPAPIGVHIVSRFISRMDWW